jgi:thiol-disulfide isomerase/thioredoxin
MKTRMLFLLLCGILVLGCDKKDTESTQNDTEVKTKDPEASKNDPLITKQKPEAPPKEMHPIENPVVAIPTKMGDRAVPLAGLEWVKGKPVKFEPGSVYVVEFWATWCGPCWTSIPHLTEIQHKYKDQKVTVIGISNETVAKVKPFVEEWGAKMDYTVAVDTKRDVGNGYMKAFNQGGIPHAFIVDGQGQLVWHGHPMGDLDRVLPEVVAGTFDFTSYAQKKAEEEAIQARINKNMRAYFTGIQNGSNDAELTKIGNTLLEEAGSTMLNRLSWDILTKVPKEKRDLTLALQAAEKANSMTEGKSAMILDTYALALFENGKVQAAIETQTKAVELAGDNERMTEGMKKQLEKFQAAVK